MPNEEFDFDAAYKVEGWDGIAWHAMFYEKVRDEDYDWTGIETENEEWVVCHMIGDDTEHTFEMSSLTKIDEEEEYCPECGQIGCGAYG